MQKFSQIGKNMFKGQINDGINTVIKSVQIEIFCALLRPKSRIWVNIAAGRSATTSTFTCVQ